MVAIAFEYLLGTLVECKAESMNWITPVALLENLASDMNRK